MAEIVNLRREKKRRARTAEAVKAEQNRALHGRTKGEAAAEAMRKASHVRQLDGAKLILRDEDGTS